MIMIEKNYENDATKNYCNYSKIKVDVKCEPGQNDLHRILKQA